MKIDDFKKLIIQNFAEVENYRRNLAPEIGAKIALEHFQASFTDEGFTDQSLVKWQDVKRRDPKSEWYGFKRENKKQFSETRTSDKILIDDRHLEDSIKKEVKEGRFKIFSSSPYASVHNFGEPAKIFGKKAHTMPKRQFVGHSAVLNKKLHDKYIQDLMKIVGIK